MTDSARHLAEAERDAAVARERLSSTMTTLQARLDPKTLARSTVSEVADRGTAAARAGVDGARRNPAIVAGIVVLAGLLLARRPITDAARRRRRSAAIAHLEEAS